MVAVDDCILAHSEGVNIVNDAGIATLKSLVAHVITSVSLSGHDNILTVNLYFHVTKLSSVMLHSVFQKDVQE